MIRYRNLAKAMLARFETTEIEHLPRGENSLADALARLASATPTSEANSRTITVEALRLPSIDDSTEVLLIQIGENWMTEIVQCLEGVIPQDQKEARHVRIKSERYCLKDGMLYRRSLSLPLLRCLSPDEAEAALDEIHKGVCGNHPGARTLAHSALRARFYWLTMRADARELVRKCAECQRFACIPRTPTIEISVRSTWTLRKVED